MAGSGVVRELRLTGPVDLRGTLGPLSHGRDPSWRTIAGGFAKATLTPAGPGCEVLTVHSTARMIRAEFYGPGADWLADRLPQLLGRHDDVAGFAPPKVLRPVWRAHPGLRVPRTGLIVESLVPVILGQKVTGVEAFASYARLLRAFGEPVEYGPFPDLVVPPSPAQWAAIPSWEWHRAGVGPQRWRTIAGAVRRAAALQRLVEVTPSEARQRMCSLPGVGRWTAAEVAQRALGDADAVSVGDFHVGRNVVFALTGATDGTDEDMLELLQPFAGHRFRIQRLVEIAGIAPPRHGPRYRGLDFRDK